MKVLFLFLMLVGTQAKAQLSHNPASSASDCGRCDWQLVIDLSESISGHDLGIIVIDGLGDVSIKNVIDQTLDLNIPAHRAQIVFELDAMFLTQGTTITQDSIGGTILTISIPRVTGCVSLSKIITVSEPDEPAPYFTSPCLIRRQRANGY